MEIRYSEPLISVIVPVYGVEKYVAKCLNTIINQTYRNLEIILVDDGTKDRSGIICEEYAKERWQNQSFSQREWRIIGC